MKLPMSLEEAINEWKRFEEYLVRSRYSLRSPDDGEPLEQDLAQVLIRISREFRDARVSEALLAGRIITATPFLMNGGNPFTKRRGYYSCYPLGPVEDSTEAIFEMERDLVTIFQHSGGGGIDVSKLRPRGAMVDNGQGTASGPVSFAKGYSQLSARISQGGKRRGALMIQADWNIKDIKEFITFKGDDPGRYAGCNVSVNVTDEAFWEDTELLRLIAESIWKSGDPGLLFTRKSVMNTPVPARYEPVYSNPCGEYLSARDTACNLVTVCLPRCLANNTPEYFEKVHETSRLAAMAGNEILDLGGFPPIPRIAESTLKFRPIGIGFTGLHQAMNHFDVSYGDEREAPRFTKITQLALMLGSMRGSLDYAEQKRQRQQTIEPCEWNQDYVGRLENEAAAFIGSSGDFDRPFGRGEEKPDTAVWLNRLGEICKHLRRLKGLYNSVTTSQAPTGSISQLLRIACTGIEPYYAMVQRRKVRDLDDSWKEFTLVPLEFFGYDEDRLDWVAAQTAHNIEPLQQIRVLEACQSFNHTAVSKTINLPARATVDDILEILGHARTSNLKGITMFRDTSMDSILGDAGQEEEGESSFSDLPERQGSTFKFRGPSPLYVTANRGKSGHVSEIFLNTTKSGSTLHGMSEALGRVISVTLQHDYRLIHKLARTLEDISSDGVWLNGLLGRVHSIPAALATVLEHCSKADVDGDPEPYSEPSTYSSCPACGRLSMCRSGGCSQCISCGYSSC